MAKSRSSVLVDTNVIIEAVRTGTWAAIAGQLHLETVEECRAETLTGSQSRPGFVRITRNDLDRLKRIHPVNVPERAALKLAYEDAEGMDTGEQDLFAHALAHPDASRRLCSPDKASIRAGVRLGWGDQLCSLEALASEVGARPNPPLANHFGESWLSAQSTRFLLE